MKPMPKGELDVIPAFSVKDGEVVIVRDNKYERLEDEDGKPLDPVLFAEQVLKQYPRILVVDINGIESNRPQLELIQAIAELGEVWVDTGIRFAESAIDILVAGASGVILGTKSIAGVDQLAAAIELSDSVFFGIDYKGAVIGDDEQLRHMSPKSLMDIASNMKFPKLFFTDLARGSGEKKLETAIIRELAAGPIPLYVGGGVSESDLEELGRLGVAGALISVSSIVTEAK